MKRGILLILTFAAFNWVVAQVHPLCGLYYMDSIEVEKNPSILERRAELEAFIKSYSFRKSKSDDTLYIPVVFHVLHKYGKERISIETAQKAIEIINNDFFALNKDLNSIITDFKGIIGTANVQFRLAQIDPEGNPTSGVVYYDTEYTYYASNSLKLVIPNWAPESYLNIWSVFSIESNAAAWSHYPGISPDMDGVVSIYSYIGSGHVLSHEIGHYLNLRHPWGNTNEPGLADNCNEDDLVNDTPNTIGADQNCNLAQVSCESLDNVQNIMDYSTCDAMFTLGQVDRMRAALNSSVSSRNNLWKESNLVKTGIQEGYLAPELAPVADFTSQKYLVLQGNAVQFMGLLQQGSTLGYNWTFQQVTSSTSDLQNPEIVFQTPGEYDVSLKVSNGKVENTLLRKKSVKVLDTLAGIIAPILYNMQDDEFPEYSDIQKQWNYINRGENNWESYSNEGNKSFRIYNSNAELGLKNTLISPNINISNIDNPDYIYFDYAFAQHSLTNTDVLKVFISKNGGVNWLVKFIEQGKSLSTNGGVLVDNDFIPTNSDWKTGKISLDYFKDANHLLIKFETTSNGGNYLYIDNLLIGQPNGVETHLKGSILKVYPNPTNSEINIVISSQTHTTPAICIYNILGELVYNANKSFAGDNSDCIKIDTKNNNFNEGIYVVVAIIEGKKYTSRFVVAH